MSVPSCPAPDNQGWSSLTGTTAPALTGYDLVWGDTISKQMPLSMTPRQSPLGYHC